jgi:type II secretory pathway pseudopilin PulG
MLMAIVILLILALLVVVAWVGYYFGAKAVRAVEYERDVLKGKIAMVRMWSAEEFREWKARLAAAPDKLEGK